MADGVDLDLFGNPMEPFRDPRGRKSFAKTKENQQFVLDMRGGGMTQAEIADVLGCDEKTLRKHFSRELEIGAVVTKAMAIRVQMQKMREGNMTAVRRVLERVDARPTTHTKPAEKREPEPGKKELARREARDVPAEWGDLLPDEQIH